MTPRTMMRWLLLGVTIGGIVPPALPADAPQDRSRGRSQEDGTGRAGPSPRTAPAPDEPAGTSVTRHAIEIDGKPLRYTATAGLLPVRDGQDNLRAEIFYVAYTREDSQPERRPVLFAFNGGPGAATIWLHLAATGPRRVVLPKEGTAIPARFRLVDNPYTWLAFADLVFVDAVGTGFSRAAPGVEARQFYATQADVQILAEFLRLYITREGRWLSPKYLVGESYGSMRAVALAARLQKDVGMFLDGLVLISSALDFGTLMFAEGNDLPYILLLPAYTATAWYHGKLARPLLRMDLPRVLAEAEAFANADYRLALAMGDALPEEQRERIVQRYARYTGLPAGVIRRSNLRVTNRQFTDEILRDRGRIVGIMDGRVTGLPAGRESFITDPSLFLTVGPLVATMYHYVRHDLDYATDRQYEFLNTEIGGQWNWGSASEGFPSVLGALRQVMSANTRLRVHMACGYYDLNTSYMSQKYCADHLLLDDSIEGNLEITYYHAGHQLYTFLPALEALTDNIRGFIEQPADTASR